VDCYIYLWPNNSNENIYRQKWFYCFSKYSPKHSVQQHLLAKKILDHAFFSLCKGTKRSHWVPSQGCTADDPPILRFGRTKKLALSWYTLIRSIFEFLQRLQAIKLLCSTKNWPFVHLLGRASSTNNFGWTYLVFEDPHGRLLLSFRLIGIDLLLCLCYEFHAFSNTCNYSSPCLYNIDKFMKWYS